VSRIVIVAATGGVGRHLLRLSVRAGHEVTAVVRSPERLAGEPVRVVRADLSAPDPAALLDAVTGAELVLSGLGARSGAEAGVASRGTAALVEAMTAAGVRRIVAVSAASVGTIPSPLRPHPPRHNPGDGPMMRYVFAPISKALFRPHYADLALMEDVLEASGLEWTVSRPPRLLDRRLRRRYRTAMDVNVRGGMFIAREDVARHMLEMADDPRTIHHRVGVAY
jgi:putative NADH-flavin reductase